MAKRQTYVIDTREKRPLELPGDVPTIRKTLATGDYAPKGYEDSIVVEWKTVQDWSNWISGDRKRFYSQVTRLLKIPYACVVVGARFGSVSHQSPATPRDSVLAGVELASLGLPVIFAENRLRAAFVIKAYLDQSIIRLKTR